MKTIRYAFVGTWKDFGGHGEGIYVYRIDSVSGEWILTDHFTGYRNNSILKIDPERKLLFSTIEDKNYRDVWGAGGGLLVLSFDEAEGKLRFIDESSAFGACTSYINTDRSGSYAVVTNHGSGLDVVTKVIREEDGSFRIVNEYDDAPLVLFRIGEDGQIGGVSDLHIHHGKGSLAVRGQVCSHLHSVNFDPEEKWVLACDKGCDRIYVYRFDRENGKLLETENTFFETRKGTAPRHLEFHPYAPYCFVNHETASAVSSYYFDSESGALAERDYQPMIDMDPAVPPELVGDTYGSPADIHVHPSGRFLYSSQRSSYHTGRGTDCIAVFEIDTATGKLKRRFVTETDGPCPRGFSIDPEGRYLFVGNQYRDTVTRFEIDETSGELKNRCVVANPSTPTCIRIADFQIQDTEE